jgi:two-component system, OmpR family, sensor kinase
LRRKRHRRLQGQLFGWLALTILATVIVVAAVSRLTQPTHPFLQRQAQVSAFAAAQFAERWDSPPAREAFTRELAQAFQATLWLTDPEGRLLVMAGAPECRGFGQTLAVQRGGMLLGQVRVCFNGQHRFGILTGLVTLAAACLVLWTAAALVARRITRPLTLLIDTTREIGSGNLRARVRLGRHSGGELGLLAESVNDMAQRIERQMRDQRELLAAVSHEVRSPLSRLRVCSELLRGDGQNASVLDAVEREIGELDDLVGQLLASSRLDFETLSKRNVVAGELWAEVLARRKLPRGLLDDQSQGRSVEVDPTLLGRALDNLLDNAVRHGQGPTRCVLRSGSRTEAAEGELTAGRSGGAGSAHAGQINDILVFEVHDQGPGFAPETLSRVFDAFYRASAVGKSEPGSLGLGLALVRRIAQAHGGQAWAVNLPGGGASVAFSVAFPPS